MGDGFGLFVYFEKFEDISWEPILSKISLGSAYVVPPNAKSTISIKVDFPIELSPVFVPKTTFKALENSIFF